MKKGMSETLLRKMRRIRLLILDVDGVLTDGRIIVDDRGSETKVFHVRDGHGLVMLMRYGIDVILLSGRRSAAVEHRARDLGIAEVHQGIHQKVEVLESILSGRGFDPTDVAYIGDDVVDIPVLRRVGLAVAVADAVGEVRSLADYVTVSPGGQGAVREVCEQILKAQGKWAEAAARYEFAGRRLRSRKS